MCWVLAVVFVTICFSTKAYADSYFVADAEGIELLWKGLASNNIEVLDLTADLNPNRNELDKIDRKIMLEKFKILPVVRIDKGDTAVYRNPDAPVHIHERYESTMLFHRDKIKSLVFGLIKPWHEYQRLIIADSQQIEDLLKAKILRHQLIVKCGTDYFDKAECCMSNYSSEELADIRKAPPNSFPVRRKSSTINRPSEQLLLEPKTFQAAH